VTTSPVSRIPHPGIIRVAHSPDADDAFMFWAMAAGKIDTEGRRYVHELSDIESLNRRALGGELEVTAVSLHAYAYLADRYALLAHGASIGDRYGPRIVSREAAPPDPRTALRNRLVAIPGELTTAFLALRLYQPATRYVVVPFDQIEDFVAAGNADAGLLIHEGQLTYADRGLHLWADMGEWWYQETRMPLPLGGNVVRRDLGAELMHAIARDLKASIEYGLAHRAEALRHAQSYSRGLDEERTDRFVGMYVNAYTVDYGPVGRRAVSELLARAHGAGIIPAPVDLAFISADS
jgi:1,4-dihydroxy-6-naphthoate synthase